MVKDWYTKAFCLVMEYQMRSISKQTQKCEGSKYKMTNAFDRGYLYLSIQTIMYKRTKILHYLRCFMIVSHCHQSDQLFQ